MMDDVFLNFSVAQLCWTGTLLLLPVLQMIARWISSQTSQKKFEQCGLKQKHDSLADLSVSNGYYIF